MSDADVIAAARRFGHNPIRGILDGMILCEGPDKSLYYICDPREDDDFDGTFTAQCFHPWGIY